MKKLLLMVCAAGLLGALALTYPAPPLYAAGDGPWVAVAQRVRTSVGYLEMTVGDDHGECSAFSIDEVHGYWMTAAHCMRPGVELKVNGHRAILVEQTDAADTAILITPRYGERALHPRPLGAPMGAEVGVAGFGHGQKPVQLRVGHVSVLAIDIGFQGGIWNQFDNGIIEGMSGGPWLDSLGRVVGLNSAGDAGGAMGVSRPMADIYKATATFWETTE